MNAKVEGIGAQYYAERLATLERERISQRGLWIGCGDFTRRSKQAIDKLREIGAEIAFVDVLEPKDLKFDPSVVESVYFNLSIEAESAKYRELAQKTHFDWVMVAHLPKLHILAASEQFPVCEGIMVLTKPADANVDILHTIKDTWPDWILRRTYIHDHYVDKSGVRAFEAILADLIRRWGRPKSFRAFLIEPTTAEQENRVAALECGVILDLMGHVAAITRKLLPTDTDSQPLAALYKHEEFRLLDAVRSQYRNAKLGPTAETFAIANVALQQRHVGVGPAGGTPRLVQGQFIVGKGIKVDQSNPGQSLKALQMEFEGRTAILNLTSHNIGPSLPLDFQSRVAEFPAESGFNLPLVFGMTTSSADLDELRRHFMPFDQAYEIACFLQDVRRQRGVHSIGAYDQHQELGELLAECRPLMSSGLDLPTEREIADILSVR